MTSNVLILRHSHCPPWRHWKSYDASNKVVCPLKSEYTEWTKIKKVKHFGISFVSAFGFWQFKNQLSFEITSSRWQQENNKLLFIITGRDDDQCLYLPEFATF